jgi:NAD+ kinase
VSPVGERVSTVTTPPPATPRRVLVVVNTRRDTVAALAVDVIRQFRRRGIESLVLDEDAPALPLTANDGEVEVVSGRAAAGCELIVVIGGDGTILRAAEHARESGTPLLGINLGHVGFLAEADPDGIDHAIDAIVERRYRSEERLTIDVSVRRGEELLASTWALNEASVEKASRERMLEVEVEVDGRPLSRWGCDGVVCSTPTGSTAYNFSAGGPIVWPEVQALLIVPLSAHALFARPMVVAPSSVIGIDVLHSTAGHGVLWCDGRRTVDLPPGARIEVRRGHCPIHLARLTDAPFTDRLVAKFDLPVSGWRGAAERRRGY